MYYYYYYYLLRYTCLRRSSWKGRQPLPGRYLRWPYVQLLLHLYVQRLCQMSCFYHKMHKSYTYWLGYTSYPAQHLSDLVFADDFARFTDHMTSPTPDYYAKCARCPGVITSPTRDLHRRAATALPTVSTFGAPWRNSYQNSMKTQGVSEKKTTLYDTERHKRKGHALNSTQDLCYQNSNVSFQWKQSLWHGDK